MEGDSCSRGHEFESQRRSLQGYAIYVINVEQAESN